jgi:5-methylcytosine-specific restriction protein A
VLRKRQSGGSRPIRCSWISALLGIYPVIVQAVSGADQGESGIGRKVRAAQLPVLIAGRQLLHNAQMTPTELLFVPEQLYHRQREIHARFGGQEQGGMITPAKHNLIFLVTGSSGRQHGYEDRWSSDGATFFYFGEGQVGDMKFAKANLALRNHAINGEDVHLFEEVPAKSGFLRYRGQMVCTGCEWVDAPDTKQSMRKAILFELVPLEALDYTHNESSESGKVADETLGTESLGELRRKALADSARCRTPVERRAFFRMRSRAIRLYVLRRAAGTCEGCATPAPFTNRNGQPYLEPHHIRRLTDGGPDDPRWVAAICPNCHRRAHYSQDAAEYNDMLEKIVFKLENSTLIADR